MKMAMNAPIARDTRPAGPRARPIPPVQKMQEAAAKTEKKPKVRTARPAHEPPDAW